MRIRQIKPEFFKHGGLGEISRDARLLFIGLWCMADNHALIKEHPKRIKIEIFPYDEISFEYFLNLLAQLEGELIKVLKVGGETWIQIIDTTVFGAFKFKRTRPSIPSSLRKKILAVGFCLYCGSTEKLCVDHIKPYSKGGTNEEANLQCLCQACNLRKGAKWQEVPNEMV